MMDYETLRSAVAGGAAAIRSQIRLQPAGGEGDKIFPPTYATDGKSNKYAFEERRIDGGTVTVVLLDSVASQANRMEEALLEAWEASDIDIPVIAVDFSSTEGLEYLDRITALQAPHRIADALLRDSVDAEGRLFRDTAVGRAYTNASVKNASAVFLYCPTALVFGVWDSTGPRGGLGNKFQRALVSEIVGVGASFGVKVGSRLDPTGIKTSATVYESEDGWTAFPEEAQKDHKGNPILFGKKTDKGKPSEINHGNVAPGIDSLAGGVTFDYALQTTVLSLPALRRLRFTVDSDGHVFADGQARREAELAARTALAALALVSVTLQREQGYDLRSRSFLLPVETPFRAELVAIDGTATEFTLDRESAFALLNEATAEAAETGLAWRREPLTLQPAPKLTELIRISHHLTAASIDNDEE